MEKSVGSRVVKMIVFYLKNKMDLECRYTVLAQEETDGDPDGYNEASPNHLATLLRTTVNPRRKSQSPLSLGARYKNFLLGTTMYYYSHSTYTVILRYVLGIIVLSCPFGFRVNPP